MEQYINNIIVIESVVKDKTLLRIIYRRDATLRKTELNFYSFVWSQMLFEICMSR